MEGNVSAGRLIGTILAISLEIENDNDDEDEDDYSLYPGTLTSKCPFSLTVASAGKLRVAGPCVTLPPGSNVEP